MRALNFFNVRVLPSHVFGWNRLLSLFKSIASLEKQAYFAKYRRRCLLTRSQFQVIFYSNRKIPPTRRFLRFTANCLGPLLL
jgi:hypothetical protein